jgi:prolipoprotein diacylglyceryl transferase
MIGLGVVAGVSVLGRMFEAKRVGTREDAGSISMWAVAAGIVGARLYHVATDWERFDDDVGAIPKIWEGGLGIPGGLVAGIGVGLYVAHRRGLEMARVATCAAPAIPLAQAIGRWGNWFNQELFGRPTDLPWALEVDADKVPLAYPADTTFHPTFLYESLWNFGLFGVLLLIDRRLRLGPGRLMAVYVMGYGVGRLWVEGLRIDPADELGGLRWNQWVSLAAIVGGGVYLLLTRGRRWPEPAPEDATPDLQDQPG